MRLWEVDSARGIAIIMMLISNLLFDLYFFLGYAELYSGFWIYFARVTAGLFLLLVGLSLTLSYARVSHLESVYKKYVKRGLWLFGVGLLVTVVTWFVVGNQFVAFGILHLIGLSIILAYPLLRLKYVNLVLGLILIYLGSLIQAVTYNQPWFFWLGTNQNFLLTVDYTPVIPWFGVVLLGIFLGNFLFAGGRRLRNVSNLPVRFLSRLGRNSLKIYLIHQPVFVGIILLILNM
ncbi:MAG: heparan-alpha-glucosaminide N-acetyltransferase [Candidatus Aenigmatarchaeota archaeon]